MMKIYNYDKETKEFLSEGFAQQNPKRKGEYLFPSCCTTVPAPNVNSCEAAVFNGEYWEIVPDYRGRIEINLETKEVSKVNYLGEIKNNCLLYSDYLQTNDYKKEQKLHEKEEKRAKILSELVELDEKRIRALCEPAVKDTVTGETWLEFYNSKISELRQNLSEVDNGN